MKPALFLRALGLAIAVCCIGAPSTFAQVASPPIHHIAADEEQLFYNPALKVGKAPFALAGTTLKGNKVSLAKWRGQVIVVDFWATWCPPCREALPNLKRLYTKYRPKGVRFLGVSSDQSEKDLRAFLKTGGFKWPQIHKGSEAIYKKYGIFGIPFVLVIGKDGKIAHIDPTEDELEPAIKKALAKK